MERASSARLGMTGLMASVVLATSLGLFSPVFAATGPVSPMSVVESTKGFVALKVLPKRNLNDRLVSRQGRAIIRGNVNPGWAKKFVIIQRATCDGCKFRKFDKVRTNKYGGWKYRLSAPAKGSWYWKGYVKKTERYGKSQTNFIYETRIA
jgi:hypothetical protein